MEGPVTRVQARRFYSCQSSWQRHEAHLSLAIRIMLILHKCNNNDGNALLDLSLSSVNCYSYLNHLSVHMKMHYFNSCIYIKGALCTYNGHSVGYVCKRFHWIFIRILLYPINWCQLWNTSLWRKSIVLLSKHSFCAAFVLVLHFFSYFGCHLCHICHDHYSHTHLWPLEGELI